MKSRLEASMKRSKNPSLITRMRNGVVENNFCKNVDLKKYFAEALHEVALSIAGLHFS